MDEITMTAQPRSVTGKKVRSLRRAGLIPVVIYGGTLETAIPAQVEERELLNTLHEAGTAQLITINVDGRQLPSLTREVQRDVVTHRIIHVDFQSVRLDRTVEAEIPVRLVGHSPLIEDELAILTHGVDSVEVEALPRDLVGRLTVDLGLLKEVGDVITVADIPVPPGITILTDPDVVVATAQPRPTEEMLEEAEEEAEGKPEIVSEEAEEAEEDDEEE
ncbi:MAG: 50S ribosomal protein L25 [Ardenticatenaceae bacterium]|nr:50S ribosomal protein L25 [Ardenticatenaceae bacterium]